MPYDGRTWISRSYSGSALDLFEEGTSLARVLGPEFARVYAIVKTRRITQNILHVISPWDRRAPVMKV